MTGGIESPWDSTAHASSHCTRVLHQASWFKKIKKKTTEKVESNVVRSLKPLKTNVVGLISQKRSSNEVRTRKMTEPEGASSEVANKSREMPTVNALASIVQFVVEEMKAMNRRMDQLNEPINLEDEEINYEEGELEHGDADRELVVSLDRKVNNWPKPTRQETKNSKSTSALWFRILIWVRKLGALWMRNWLTLWIVSSKT